MKYESQTYGFAGILLPDGGTKLVHFNGTIEEAQRQLDTAAKECGGTALDLKAMEERNPMVRVEKLAAHIFNEGFKASG